MKSDPKTVASLAAVALLSATVVLVSFWAFGKIDQVAEARKHSYAVIDHADNLRSALKDAENGKVALDMLRAAAYDNAAKAIEPEDLWKALLKGIKPRHATAAAVELKPQAVTAVQVELPSGIDGRNMTNGLGRVLGKKPRDIERGLKAGFFRYLTKPIKLETLMDALDLALDAAQHGQASVEHAL